MQHARLKRVNWMSSISSKPKLEVRPSHLVINLKLYKEKGFIIMIQILTLCCTRIKPKIKKNKLNWSSGWQNWRVIKSQPRCQKPKKMRAVSCEIPIDNSLTFTNLLPGKLDQFFFITNDENKLIHVKRAKMLSTEFTRLNDTTKATVSFEIFIFRIKKLCYFNENITKTLGKIIFVD